MFPGFPVHGTIKSKHRSKKDRETTCSPQELQAMPWMTQSSFPPPRFLRLNHSFDFTFEQGTSAPDINECPQTETASGCVSDDAKEAAGKLPRSIFKKALKDKGSMLRWHSKELKTKFETISGSPHLLYNRPELSKNWRKHRPQNQTQRDLVQIKVDLHQRRVDEV